MEIPTPCICAASSAAVTPYLHSTVDPLGQFMAANREDEMKIKQIVKELRILINFVVFIVSPFDKNHCTKQQGSVAKYSCYDTLSNV